MIIPTMVSRSFYRFRDLNVYLRFGSVQDLLKVLIVLLSLVYHFTLSRGGPGSVFGRPVAS